MGSLCARIQLKGFLQILDSLGVIASADFDVTKSDITAPFLRSQDDELPEGRFCLGDGSSAARLCAEVLAFERSAA